LLGWPRPPMLKPEPGPERFRHAAVGALADRKQGRVPGRLAQQGGQAREGDMRGPIKDFVMVGAVLTAALSTSLLGAGPALAAVWTVAPSPPTGQDAYINGIAARTDADAWAVGSVGQQSSKVGSLPLIDHWNGTTWSQATPPSFPATNGVHLGWVSSSSATDAWAVGTINQVKHPGYFGPLTVHWDGSTWANVPDPLPLNPGTALVGVADISSTDAYTVGNQGWHAHRDHSPLGLRCVGRGVHHRATDPHPALGWHYLDDRVQPQCGQRQPADVGICQPWRRDCLGCRVQRRLGLVQPAHPSERLTGKARDPALALAS
jgi:hypothetical protein